MPTSTGAIAANFHEGSRSEYLAQYVFSAFGTSIPVPHPEDHGIDLFCTLAERKGRLAWPDAYYSVQVKSTDDPWHFGDQESVKWLLRHPAPLFLCIVDKRSASIRVYQTAARFTAGMSIEPPSSITLIPGEEGESYVISWDSTGNLQLGAPILKFAIAQFTEDKFFKKLREVLRFWILSDARNVLNHQMGVRSFSHPSRYATNEIPPRGTISHYLGSVTPEIKEAAQKKAFENLEWLVDLDAQEGDHLSVLLTALLLRHHNHRAAEYPTAVLRASTQLDSSTTTEGDRNLFAPIDVLLKRLRENITPKHIVDNQTEWNYELGADGFTWGMQWKEPISREDLPFNIDHDGPPAAQ